MAAWSTYEVAFLGQCIDRGLSAGETARQMRGRSREACLGKAWHLGWGFGCPRTDEQRAAVPTTAAERLALRRAQYAAAPPAARPGHAVTVRFDDETYAEILKRAEAGRLHRTQIVRELVEWGLEAA